MAKSRARKLADIIVGAGVDIDGNLTFDGGSTSEDLTFADGDKANFGDASDLQIYHSSSESWIKDSGSGSLYIDTDGPSIQLTSANSAKNMVQAIKDGAVNLFYNNSTKLATTSSGVTVTGSMVATSAIVDNVTAKTSSGSITFKNNSGSDKMRLTDAGNLGIGTNSPTEPLTVSETSSGNTMQVASFVNPVGTANTGVRLWLSGTNTTTRGTFIDAVAESTANNHSLRFGTSASSSAPTERMRIDASGNLGLGTTSPNSYTNYTALTINGTNGGLLDFETNGTFVGEVFADSTTGLALQSIGSRYIRFLTNSGERMRITSTGKVGIGTTAPANRLHVKAGASGASTFDARYNLVLEDDGENYIGFYVPNNSFSGIRFVNGSSSLRGYIDYYHGSQGDKMHLYAQNSIQFDFPTTGTAAIIKQDGKVGIGNTSPAYKLDVNGTGNFVNTLQVGALTVPTQGITLNQGFGTGVPTMTMLGTAANGRAGAILFQEQGASNTAAIYSTDGASGNASYGGLTLATYQSDIRFSTAGLANARMIITSTGNVGIGTTSPSANLEVENSSGATIMVDDTNGRFIKIRSANSGSQNANISSYSGLYLGGSDNASHLLISNSGNVGIGTSSPTAILETVSATSGGAPVFRAGTADFLGAVIGTAGAGFAVESGNYFSIWHQPYANRGTQTNLTERLRITDGGDVSIGSDHSGFSGWRVLNLRGQSTGALVNFEANDGTRRAAIANSGNQLRIQTTVGGGNITFETGSGTERARIDGAGNFGMGTTTPSYKLDVNAGSAIAARFKGGDSNGITSIFTRDSEQGLKTWSGNSYYSGLVAGAHFQIFTNNSPATPRVTVLDAGNVGIGTTSPGSTLDVHGNTNLGSDNIGAQYTTTLSGFSVTANGSDYYGSYGSLILNSNQNYTSTSRPYMITNALGANKFAIISGTNATTDPTIGQNGNITSGSARLVIDNEGNVGINDTAPDRKVSIIGDNTSNGKYPLSLDATDTDYTLEFRRNGSSSWWIKQASSSFNIHANGVGDHLRILASNGYVGIGTTSPNAKLHIDPGTNFSKPSLIINSPSNYSEGDLYVLHGRNVNTGIGFSATGFGVNVQEEIPSDNIPQLRSNTGGLTSAGLMYVGADEVSQGVFGVMGATGSAGTDLSHLFTVRSSGNVGIGTTNPGKKLHVDGVIGSQNSAQGTGFLELQGYGNTGYINMNGSGSLFFRMGSSYSTLMTLTAAGRLGIGTTAPSNQLVVKSGTNVDMEFGSEPGGGFIQTYNRSTPGYGYLRFITNGETMRLINTGQVGIGTTSVDTNAGVEIATVAPNTGVTTLRLTNAVNNKGQRIDFEDDNAARCFTLSHDNGSNVTYMGTLVNEDFTFYTNSAERMRIDSSGNIRLGGSTTNGTTLISSCTSTNTSGGNGTGNNLDFEFMEPSSPNFGAKKLRLGVQGGGYVKMTYPGSAGMYTFSPYSDSDKIHLGYGGLQLDMLYGGYTTNENMLIRCRNNISFSSGGSNEKMRLDSSGSLLINDSTPSAKLWVNRSDNGNAFGARATASSYAATVGFFGADRNTTNNTFYYIDCYNYGNSTYRFRVADSGNVTNTNNSYGALSDIKLKENIVDATPKLDKLNKVRVVNYNFIGSDEKYLGVIAQELEQIMPSMVDENVDTDADGNDLGTTTKTVKYSVFVPMLIKAIQEQTEIINDLRARVADIEGE